jgi:hypothetical protein
MPSSPRCLPALTEHTDAGVDAAASGGELSLEVFLDQSMLRAFLEFIETLPIRT